MPRNRDETSGKYRQTVSDREILDFLREQRGGSTAEVASFAGFEQASAYRRLKRLEQHGDVTGRRIGNSLLWEVDRPDDGPEEADS